MPRPSAGSHHNNKLHVKKGDTVIVLSGKHKGEVGEVLFASPSAHKVVVKGVNLVLKNIKADKSLGREGEQVRRELALHASKVALVDPETGKATRVRKAIVDGKKVRVAVSTGKNID